MNSVCFNVLVQRVQSECSASKPLCIFMQISAVMQCVSDIKKYCPSFKYSLHSNTSVHLVHNIAASANTVGLGHGSLGKRF